MIKLIIETGGNNPFLRKQRKSYLKKKFNVIFQIEYICSLRAVNPTTLHQGQPS